MVKWWLPLCQSIGLGSLLLCTVTRRELFQTFGLPEWTLGGANDHWGWFVVPCWKPLTSGVELVLTSQVYCLIQCSNTGNILLENVKLALDCRRRLYKWDVINQSFSFQGVICTVYSWNKFCGFGNCILQFQCGRNMFWWELIPE